MLTGKLKVDIIICRYNHNYAKHAFNGVWIYNMGKLIAFSKPGKNCCDFLEKLINKRVIADSEVTRFDYNAEIIISKLFETLKHFIAHSHGPLMDLSFPGLIRLIKMIEFCNFRHSVYN